MWYTWKKVRHFFYSCIIKRLKHVVIVHNLTCKIAELPKKDEAIFFGECFLKDDDCLMFFFDSCVEVVGDCKPMCSLSKTVKMCFQFSFYYSAFVLNLNLMFLTFEWINKPIQGSEFTFRDRKLVEKSNYN